MKKSFWKKKKTLLTSVVTFVFLALVSYLLFQNLREVKWEDVSGALARVSSTTMFLAGLVTLTIYGILTTYDYMAFRHLKQSFMTYPRVMVSAFLCYAFNFNLGAVVGGVGFRFRIYTGWGVPKAQIPALVTFSTLTNWMGFSFLSGVTLLVQNDRIKKLIPLPGPVLTLLGCVFLSTILLYAWAAFKNKTITVKAAKFTFPSPKLMLVQLPLAIVQWGLPSLVLSLFLQSMGHSVPFGEILSVFLTAGLLGAVSHIPAGLGLIETAYLRAGFDVPASDMLAALLCFRSVYYLVPLIVAIPTYLGLEYHLKSRNISHKCSAETDSPLS